MHRLLPVEGAQGPDAGVRGILCCIFPSWLIIQISQNFLIEREYHFLQVVGGNGEQRKNHGVFKQLLLDCEVLFDLSGFC